MTAKRIPWAQPILYGMEATYVAKALESTWISGGPYVEELEKRIAEFQEVPFALAVNNGTSAIHLAYLGIGLQPGDEVIVPGFGFLAAANIALHMHAKPVFAEVDPDTWCLTAETVAPCLTPRTRAIVAVHTYGNVAPMAELCELGRRHGIPVIEDVAEAFGSRYQGKPAGSFGTLACFSFQATKTITTGEGGMVLTRDADLHKAMLLYRSHGMNQRRYWHEVPGHNFRLTNFQAAMGCAQLDALETIVSQRQRMHQPFIATSDNGGPGGNRAASLDGRRGPVALGHGVPARAALFSAGARSGHAAVFASGHRNSARLLSPVGTAHLPDRTAAGVGKSQRGNDLVAIVSDFA